MSGKKTSPPELEIDFLETGHEDRYMQEVFDHIDKVPDKEPLPKIPAGKKSKEKRDSPFSQLSGADEQIDLHGKTREEAIMICLLYTSPSPRDRQKSRMPSSA